MPANIHYQIQRINVKTDKETPSLTAQWQQVAQICKAEQLGEVARARLAFNVVDYITSEDLPLRLLLTRAPQAMAQIGTETTVHKEHRTINGKSSAMVYSKIEQMLPKEICYTTNFLATRYINGQTKPLQTSSLLEALKQEAFITALDGIFFLGCKRIASDIARLRKQNPKLNIVMKRVEVSDSFTGTTRKMACYSLM
ncbi:hypothetical protein I6Y99_004553 [Vibrio parahaemolyticus]|uniref:hypothetical protein n=1 Tax=Vibrio parahaemolyticus TaxID=670 RepID=UPI001A1BC6D3|nr:hypothetical protein [Vibrio parahaemolyticus]EGQ7795932.1 hypothetical protein [Vibrio parahaemolyticus]EGQ7810509.1 hypothetical protein [Vibrio parahaemolyticus]EGQ8533353.1 hypothetical protein [Vibrio parahaemolyticus]EJB8505152.1 hypothetical protein [Vibrio parahaemolyticus]EJB8691181.1 hypothetical protein [Vibrio parahaemolyticus]